MKKINKKGFAIAEVLAVAIVVMVIFMTVYSSFFPTTAEYEKRIEYNDVESLYATYYMRKIYNDVDFSSINNSTTYITLYKNNSCQKLSGDLKTKCNNIASSFGIEEMIVTKNNISKVKNKYTSGKLAKYISYLPNYSLTNTTEEEYRLIVKTKTGYATSLLKYTVPFKANPPELSAYMLPVYYDDNGNIFVADSSKDSWYDYDNAKWANAVTIKDSKKGTYFDNNGNVIASIGTKVNLDDINTMWVWIPRYKYTIFNYNSDGTSSMSKIEKISISFEEGKTSTGTVKCTDNVYSSTTTTSETCYYESGGSVGVEIKNNSVTGVGSVNGTTSYTHPAFTFGDTELAGIWVGKFENTALNSNGYVTILPNKTPLSGKKVATLYTNSGTGLLQKIKTNENLDSDTDTHLMKNTEWGAVVYLTLSEYGIYNKNNGVGGFNVKTGKPLNATMEVSYKSNKLLTSAISEIKYSTTYNRYGVYDMNGGVAEITMANKNSSVTNNSNDKYYDYYAFNTSTTDAKIGKLGDATKEVTWYNNSWGGWFYTNPTIPSTDNTLNRGCVSGSNNGDSYCASGTTLISYSGVSKNVSSGNTLMGSRSTLIVR